MFNRWTADITIKKKIMILSGSRSWATKRPVTNLVRRLSKPNSHIDSTVPFSIFSPTWADFSSAQDVNISASIILYLHNNKRLHNPSWISLYNLLSQLANYFLHEITSTPSLTWHKILAKMSVTKKAVECMARLVIVHLAIAPIAMH